MNSLSAKQTIDLSTDQVTTLSMLLHKLSLAKNISLMPNTSIIWAQLITEDIQQGVFNMHEFIDSVSVCIRKPMYNRIDYADIYEEAKLLADKRKRKERVYAPDQVSIDPDSIAKIIKIRADMKDD
jgi:hypothetical protein